jgi:3-oxoacyl-[acyl-carrier protein] reductase
LQPLAQANEKGDVFMAKTYLITGASSDVGHALMERLMDGFSEGDCIIAQGSGDLGRIADLCQAHPGVIHPYDVDLTSSSALDAFIADVSASYPTPTHIIHLPALRAVNTKFKNFDEERFDLDMNVSVKSAVRICKTFVPKMAKAKFGRVLFIQTSYTLGCPPKNMTAYVMAKSAIGGLVKSLAVEYAGTGVTVNCVAPSMMETNFLKDTPDLIVQAAAADNPMGRNCRVSDVVPAMAFLLSDEAAFITGVTLPVTGGSAIV